MWKFRSSPRVTALRTGVLAVLSGAVLLVAPSAAMAGGNWAEQLGATGSGCYVWSTWTSNTVAAHIYQQANDIDGCYVGIEQYWRDTGAVTRSQTGSDWNSVHQPGSVASVPNNPPYDYYYYGPASGGYLCVYIWAGDYHYLGYTPEQYYGDSCQ